MKIKKVISVGMMISFLGTSCSAWAERNWTGVYAGVNTGYAMMNGNTVITPLDATSKSDFGIQGLAINASGPILGGQLGYNYQLRNFVLGFEVDFDGFGASGSRQSTPVSQLPTPNPDLDGFMASESLKSLASIRGRAGFLMGPGMLYATSGIGWADVNVNALLSPDTAPDVYVNSTTAAFSTIRQGFVVGGGYEWPFANNWSLRSEYLYYYFGGDSSINVNQPVCDAGTCSEKVTISRFSVNSLRVAINYRFDFAPAK